jgi:hypothetical protein
MMHAQAAEEQKDDDDDDKDDRRRMGAATEALRRRQYINVCSTSIGPRGGLSFLRCGMRSVTCSKGRGFW